MSKILIADDAMFMRTVIRNNIKGFLPSAEVFEAGNGLEAVAMYKRHRPDLIMLDITMPEMDGLTALREIRTEFPDALAIMCSAMGQEQMVIEAIKNGARDFIVKPFKPEKLQESMLKLIPAEIGSPE